MGLAQTQQVLAQLYTNTELRKRFFAHPHAVGAELGLSDSEIQQLSQLSVQEVNVFANSLKWKRLGEVRELLPRTVRVLGKNFTTLFWRYAETYLPQGIKKHRKDAMVAPRTAEGIAFANFIEKVAQVEGIDPAWVSDLARYEKTWLLVDELHRGLQVCWFRYPVGSLGSTDANLSQPTIAVWWRFSGRSHLHHILLPAPVYFSSAFLRNVSSDLRS
ncbi:hypothetical protein [Calothrix sp. PCC 7507]|uniref:hypothetical protein n=1 Tax=Calothrix sp. PCC 7507 TaxID=99598 RepID=UPI00029F0349|nr:hypothetical protein [Calothrix sp. PCC 7507]AFY32789.1 hypothetical protein Cal7507_2358 [Calothrix sp. PCC 7507]